MSVVTVLGAGAGGLAVAVELARAGHDVRLWSRNPVTIAPNCNGTISYSGVLGEGRAKMALVTTDLPEALQHAEGAIVVLPGFVHGALFAELADLGWSAPVVLSPGHTGGALHCRRVFALRKVLAPPVAELSTLPYVCRRDPAGAVHVLGLANRLRCGALPGGEEATALAKKLLSCEIDCTDVLASSLSNINLVLHPPGAILAAAWVEATAGRFTFYFDAMTPGVGSVVDALDSERLDVARRFGHELPALAEEMVRAGTASPGNWQSTVEAVRSGEANRSISAPSSLTHRYYKEDFAYGLGPFLAFAAAAGVAAPVARSLLTLGCALVGAAMPPHLDAAALGIEGMDACAVARLVRA